MRKMSKFASLLDKYGNVDEDTERHLGKIDWSGHIKAQGTFRGSAFMTGYKDSFIATDLKSDSNPRGSILREAKNYTDAQIAAIGGGDGKLYCHCISFVSDSNSKGGYIIFNYYSKKQNAFTYNTFKNEFNDSKQVACSGYINDGDNFFTAFYIQLAANGPLKNINVQYYDAVNHMYKLTAIHWFNFQDNVSEVI